MDDRSESVAEPNTREVVIRRESRQDVEQCDAHQVHRWPFHASRTESNSDYNCIPILCFHAVLKLHFMVLLSMWSLLSAGVVEEERKKLNEFPWE